MWLLLLQETFVLLIKFGIHHWRPSDRLRSGQGLSFPPERAPRAQHLSLPPLAPSAALIIICSTPKSRMEWAGHFCSSCSECHLHPCSATLCFYSDRAFVTSVFGSTRAGASASSWIRWDFAPVSDFWLVYSPFLQLVYVPGDALG